MAISTYGDLKGELSAYLFHQRLLPRYDTCTQFFEADANSRLRVLPMEAVALLTTVSGEAALPTDYLAWRAVKPATTPYIDELDYVHPAYLPAEGREPTLFTIEANTFKARPNNDVVDAYELHYYRKISTLTGSDLNSNWLLLEYPNAYLFGVLLELAAVQRNQEMAQLYKARRDEVFAELTQRYALTTGATSASVRSAEYY